jgi:hypothetical protein
MTTHLTYSKTRRSVSSGMLCHADWYTVTDILKDHPESSWLGTKISHSLVGRYGILEGQCLL